MWIILLSRFSLVDLICLWYSILLPHQVACHPQNVASFHTPRRIYRSIFTHITVTLHHHLLTFYSLVRNYLMRFQSPSLQCNCYLSFIAAPDNLSICKVLVVFCAETEIIASLFCVFSAPVASGRCYRFKNSVFLSSLIDKFYINILLYCL
jgi:hypothetical protein